jgi:hypothetical protein
VNVVLLILFLLFLNSHVYVFARKWKFLLLFMKKIKSTIIREWNERIRKSYSFLHSLKLEKIKRNFELLWASLFLSFRIFYFISFLSHSNDVLMVQRKLNNQNWWKKLQFKVSC